MVILTLCYYSCFILYVFIGAYVLRHDLKSPVNRSFAVMCFFLSLWALGYSLLNTTGDVVWAHNWMTLAAVGWNFFFSSWLYFALMLTERDGVFTKKWSIALLYLPSLGFLIRDLSIPLEGYIRTAWGWIYMYPWHTLGEYVYNIYYMSFSLLAIALIYSWGKNNSSLYKRMQAKIICTTSITAVVLGALSDTILPTMGIAVLPMGIVFIAIVMIGIRFAIEYFHMMNLTSGTVVNYVLETMNDPVIYVDNELKIKAINNAALTMLDYAQEDLLGLTAKNFLYKSGLEDLELERILREQEMTKMEIEIVTRGGKRVTCLLSGSVIKDRLDQALGKVCLFHEITDQKMVESLLRRSNVELEAEVQRRIRELAETSSRLAEESRDRQLAQDLVEFVSFYDSVTGLPNRNFLRDRIQEAICRSQEDGPGLAIVFLDTDDFKLINDTMGYSTGDQLLKLISGRIQEVLRKSDTLGRLGGDEFLIVAEDINDIDQVDVMVQRIVSAFAAPFIVSEKEQFVSFSIGIAIYPADGQDSESLITNAEMAMCEAKRAGRNTYKYSLGEMKARAANRMELKNHLYRALEKDELSLHYQPLVEAVSGRILAFEALMRWNLKHERYIPPLEFIGIAEETGLIVSMGEWAIRTACRQIKLWNKMTGRPLKMAVNLSEKQLKQRGFPEMVELILTEVDLEPSLLEFEITERIMFRSNQHIVGVLRQLKDMGITISIDDFGIDHSSFMNIKELPIDKIKIAMEFVRGINENARDRAIVSSIIDLAHKLGLNTVAEGVENFEQLMLLRKNKCDIVQGYFFHRPMPPQMIDEILISEAGYKNKLCVK